ncbi:MAG: hypothetical protein WC758_05025 [Candidatus Woesearchaeota archaeon]|jgi:hypothetical protein
MDVLNEYKKLVESDVFLEFESSSKDFYLVHIYKMLGGSNESSLEFGFYNQETDRIVVFETNPIRKRAEEEVFKEAETIHPLKLENVKLSLDDALLVAEQFRKEKYSSEVVYQTIMILQNIDRQVWNITLITLSFNILNIRIDAQLGVVVDSSIHSIMSIGNKLQD